MPEASTAVTVIGTAAPAEVDVGILRRSATAPTLVAGPEHFADVLTQMACGAAPLRHPITGRMLGVVDLTCRARDASPLLLTLARRAARDVADRLAGRIDDPVRAADGAQRGHVPYIAAAVA